MWTTIFVIEHKEILSNKDFPAFQPGGKVFLRMRDQFTEEDVNVGYRIEDVFYDLHSQIPKQYIYLVKLEGF